MYTAGKVLRGAEQRACSVLCSVRESAWKPAVTITSWSDLRNPATVATTTATYLPFKDEVATANCSTLVSLFSAPSPLVTTLLHQL